MLTRRFFPEDMRFPATGMPNGSSSQTSDGGSPAAGATEETPPAGVRTPSGGETPPAVPKESETVEQKLSRLEQELEASQAQIGRQSSELAIYRDIVDQGGAPPVPSGGAAVQDDGQGGRRNARYFKPEDSQRFMNDPMGFLEEAASRLVEEMDVRFNETSRRQEQLSQAKKELYDEFYTANPDLKGLEDIVFTHAQKVIKLNPGVKNPRVLLPKIADSVRTFVEDIRKKGEKPKPTPTPAADGSQMSMRTAKQKNRSEEERVKLEKFMNKH